MRWLWSIASGNYGMQERHRVANRCCWHCPNLLSGYSAYRCKRCLNKGRGSFRAVDKDLSSSTLIQRRWGMHQRVMAMRTSPSQSIIRLKIQFSMPRKYMMWNRCSITLCVLLPCRYRDGLIDFVGRSRRDGATISAGTDAEIARLGLGIRIVSLEMVDLCRLPNQR